MINKVLRDHRLQVVFKNIFSKSFESGSAQSARATGAKMDKKILPVGSAARTNFEKIIATSEIQLLSSIFKTGGHDIRIAGGAVRDLLTGSIPHDIDFATTATPSQMISFLSPHQKDIRIITTKAGEKHGTITARINDRVQYEVTTLRIDKITDGRHAEVEFIQDWILDASRRDLTINSMFLDMDGFLYDYFNGFDDLEKKLIRFVGDPVERIQEDFLRILRYFRFYARYGCGQNYHEPTLKAIRNNMDGLSSISGERIWSEMKRIIPLRQCNVVIPVMFRDLQLGRVMGFLSEVGDASINEFHKIQERLFRDSNEILPITLFISLMSSDDELESVIKRLKLSNQESDIATFIIANRGCENVTMKVLKKKLALSPRQEQCSIKLFMIEFLKYSGRLNDAKELGDWKIPEFPFKGHLLREKVKSPRDVGRVITSLKDLWANNNYEISDDEIRQRVEEILNTDDK